MVDENTFVEFYKITIFTYEKGDQVLAEDLRTRQHRFWCLGAYSGGKMASPTDSLLVDLDNKIVRSVVHCVELDFICASGVYVDSFVEPEIWDWGSAGFDSIPQKEIIKSGENVRNSFLNYESDAVEFIGMFQVALHETDGHPEAEIQYIGAINPRVIAELIV